MGTEVHVLLPEDRGDAIALVRALFESWEATLSRFRPESELSRLNARAGDTAAAGPLLFHVVATALDAARSTDGAFDPTLLRQLVGIGYGKSFARMSDMASAASALLPRRGGGWRSIALDRRARTIRLPAGCGLDLGGIAKGMAVDAALDLLAAHGVRAALVSAGGDLAVRGLPPHAHWWPVLVGDEDGPVVPLVRGALATSGIARRSWLQGEVRRHHLVDPETGEPAENGLHEVSVAAGRCEVAEVAATAAFVLGPDDGGTLLRRHGLAGLLTLDDGTQLGIGSWPARLRAAA